MLERDPDIFPKQDILCIDCKSFFASIECVERGLDPLTDKLCVVSRPHLKGGLVLASSPRMKAEYGIGTGSRVYDLPKRDSDIVLAPARMNLYVQRNHDINRIFLQYVAWEDLHVYSIDEAFLDVGRSHALFGSSYQIAWQIQHEIYKRYGLPTCVGIGDNLLLAKLCLDNVAKYRPPYLAYWSYARIPETVWKIEKLSDFWGIGRRTQTALEAMGIYTVRDLAHADLGKLKARFGVKGAELYYHANGLDASVIREAYSPQSQVYSASQILERNYLDYRQVALVVREMADNLASRLRREGRMTSCLGLGIGYGKDIVPKRSGGQMTFELTSSSKQIMAHSQTLLKRHYFRLPVKSLHLTVSHLQAAGPTQLSLFQDPEQSAQEERAERVVDAVRERYGYGSLVRASSLLPGATAIQRSALIGGH